MWMLEIPPFLPFFIGALLAGFTRGILRNIIMVSIPVVSALHLWTVPEEIHLQFAFLDYQLMPYRADKLSLMFGYVFHIAAFIAIIYSLHVRDAVQQVSAMLYAGSGLGAVFAGDLLTLFVFWELLAFTSVFLIWARRTQRSYVAGIRYLIIQVLSGVILLAGTLFYASGNGSLEFGHIGLEGVAGWLIFIAFGIKCAFPMAHNWLTDAYPEATVTGTVFLSAFTTKVAVYSLARGYPGTELLVYIGAAMTCFPIFFAVIENDLRRVLAYSLINQVGFMVVGIGIGTALALNGAISHAFNDVIFKGLLFMSMGAVLHMTGKVNGSELGGLYKTMPKTTILCIVGAASISAFPLFSGFVSKSMVMSAALENGYDWIWPMLLFASAGVFHHAGIKIPYFAFFAHDSGIRVSDPPNNMLLAMFFAAALCIAIGVYPAALYSLLPYDTGYNPYDATHVLAQTQLLFFSALAFVWLNLKGMYPPELRSTNLDFDWIYRRALPQVVYNMFTTIDKADRSVRGVFLANMNRLLVFLSRRHEGTSFLLSHTYPVGSMVLWVAVILATYLFRNYSA
ncbi:MAG: Na(+)/H(+) antiporter subunit D [gamma proteobacterium symbiont of Bathyaustriella thionipta]|nr:Na(+)/H(+) antiporter subunit D [gamma proteobacterium symbiont of Bathyaustriella thionipta]MCU7950046.1 Na(+)/H(+) antiporter subunit D [gamma proteobacterium symbiont of Bathyaustriella thionipta]MCU7952419.1 Na(+)/H(+) antiporter subunit D [gamma proteobacterium symbiont of Bathyaustriella thionipta]MCU7956642.1 Na(+)/H(+) antiporter subunit D [gamma proteobacterium symbiont of Bathyaustriella thionipta]MCU7968030.1 Na(+)/H(+) antiporter subunit D [gamma proteobacterium symbiont of Bathy